VGEECGEQGLGRGAAGRRLVTQAAQMLCIGVAGAGEKEFFRVHCTQGDWTSSSVQGTESYLGLPPDEARRGTVLAKTR